MAKQELTDPKSSPDGKEDINVGLVDTEQAFITKPTYSQGLPICKNYGPIEDFINPRKQTLYKNPETKILGRGFDDDWDDTYVAEGEIIPLGGSKVVMLYPARSDTEDYWRMGIAISYDGGKSFNKYTGNPVFEPSTSGWDSEYVKGTTVLMNNGEFWMYYHAQGSDGNYRIGLAKSPDLINWTRYTGNPILQATDFGLSVETLSNPTIIKDGDGVYYLSCVYNVNEAIYIWRSNDGETGWEMLSNPIIPRGGSGDFDEARAQDPDILKIGDTYYCTYGAEDSEGNYTIGLAYTDELWTPNWNKHGAIMSISTNSFRTSLKVIDGELYLYYDLGDIYRAKFGLDKNILRIPKTLVRAYMDADQTIPSGSLTTVNIDTINYDKLNEFNTTNNQLKVRVPGIYEVVFSGRFASTIPDGVKIIGYIEAGTHPRSQVETTTGASEGTTAGTVYFCGELDRGDTINAGVHQSTGSDQTLASGQVNTYIFIRRVDGG